MLYFSVLCLEHNGMQKTRHERMAKKRHIDDHEIHIKKKKEFVNVCFVQKIH